MSYRSREAQLEAEVATLREQVARLTKPEPVATRWEFEMPFLAKANLASASAQFALAICGIARDDGTGAMWHALSGAALFTWSVTMLRKVPS